MSHLPALVLTLAFLAGCTPMPSGADPDPTDSGDPALIEARTRWADAGLMAYRYQIQYSCFCPPEAMGPFIVLVRNGTEATSEEAVPEFVTLPTIEELFAMIEEAYAQDASTVEVTYEERLGYPLAIFIDYDEMMADEEYRATVVDLEPLGN